MPAGTAFQIRLVDMDSDVVRRYFVFALRDVLPLDHEGWHLFAHTEDCPRPCNDLVTCRGSHAQIVQVPAEDSGLRDATAQMMRIIDDLVGSPTDGSRPAMPSMPPGSSSYAIVSTAVVPNESDESRHKTFSMAFELLQRAVDGLRHVTWSRVPALTIERVWPWYFVLEQRSNRLIELSQGVMVEHGTFFRSTAQATAEQLQRANNFIVASFNQDPAENFRWHHLAAHNAAFVEGDYGGAVLKAAAAAEILIKHAAAMLIWEASSQPNGSPDWASLRAPLTLKPSKLISQVLSPALKGGWSSQHTHQPVGAWRHHIAQARNNVIHRGRRPAAEDAEDALTALQALVTHLNDRLAATATTYPKTAVMLAGEFGLEKRGAWGKVRAALANGSVDDWRSSYRQWVDATDTTDPLMDED